MPDDVRQTHAPQPEHSGDGWGSRMPWLVVAALVLVVAGVGGLVLRDSGGDDDTTEPTGADAGEAAAADGSDDDAVDESITQLEAPAGPDQARCAMPSPRILARHPLAFDGTVTHVAEGEVTIEPAIFYAGTPTDLVVVKAPPAQLRNLLLSVDFEPGRRYLVAADGGRVAICGYSGPWSADLEGLYLEAFPG